MRDVGLSESSIKKYGSAITGPLSQWARDAGLISGTIASDADNESISDLVELIRKTDIFQERNQTGNGMYASALNHFQRFFVTRNGLASDIVDILQKPTQEETIRAQLINARLGQGKFRADLIELWKRCALSGYADVSLLVASHIKPWAKASNLERLDKYNGLLLTPNFDAAFDKGLISFNNEGSLIISDRLAFPSHLGIEKTMRIKLFPKNLPYIEFHRNIVFKG